MGREVVARLPLRMIPEIDRAGSQFRPAPPTLQRTRAMSDNKTELRKLWDTAEKEPGTKQRVGRIVVCDQCDEDFTDKPDSGGFMFVLNAYCPQCAARSIDSIRKYNEEHFIRARCVEGQSFADFVRAYRGPDAFIRYTKVPR